MILNVLKQVRYVQIKMFTLSQKISLSVFFSASVFYCSYESVSLITREGIFLKENAKLGTAAHSLCNSLQRLIENYAELVDGYIHSSHVNRHGIRKGSATYSTSGTRVLP